MIIQIPDNQNLFFELIKIGNKDDQATIIFSKDGKAFMKCTKSQLEQAKPLIEKYV